MFKKNLIPGLIIIPFLFFVFFSCSKKEPDPIETCFDNIKNQNEVQTDCGGYCRPCPYSMTAKINGVSWVADTVSISASYSNSGTKFLIKGNASNFYPQISLIYLGPLSLGAHELDHASSLSPSFTGTATFVSSGTLTISELDTRSNLVSGSFSFTSADGSTTYSVTDGTFLNISYRLN
jgi:hypothetical protein